MPDLFSSFTNRYSVSKTLRFSLLPQYETKENIDKMGLIEEDEHRAEDYVKLKEVFDACHKEYIARMLPDYGEYLLKNEKARKTAAKDKTADWELLAEALEQYRQSPADDKTKKHLEEVQGLYRKQLSGYLKPDKAMKAATIIEDALKEADKPGKDRHFYISELEEHIEALRRFKGFAGYFISYDQTRDNIYASEGVTAIAYRLVNENFPKFIANINRFKKLPAEIRAECMALIAKLDPGMAEADIFTVNYFSRVLTQAGIDTYNTLLGGIAGRDLSVQEGINQLCNLAFQQGRLPNKTVFEPLYKQILSDREHASFVLEGFETDTEMHDAVTEYEKALRKTVAETEQDLRAAFFSEELASDCIYTDKKQLPVLSNLLTGEWNTWRDKLPGKSRYTLKEITAAAQTDVLKEVYKIISARLEEAGKAGTALKGTPFAGKATADYYIAVKNYLDAVISLEDALRLFAAPEEAEKDSVFYVPYDTLYRAVREVIPVYNKVRNYATKKPYSEDKFKLTFRAPTLLNGWDKNKEQDNCCMLFRREGNYYLGILNAKNKIRFAEADTAPSGPYFEKMVYKYLPTPSKMLPKCFNKSGKWIAAHGLPANIEAGYEAGRHKTGETFDLDFMRELCDYYKDCIRQYPDWAAFDFRFSDSSAYTNLNDFYGEIERQNYKITFTYVKEEDIRKAVREGRLYFFRIYSKDFSEYAKGTPNLHTIYWRALFAPENLREPVLKLNGEAEVFYRRASIDTPFAHARGSVLINKKDLQGQPVPEALYMQAAEEAGHTADTDSLKEKYPNLIFKIADREIIKDRRYTSDSFAFHCPITFNRGAEGSERINADVLRTLTENDDFYVIGIDRGERNLLYVSVIDRHGHIMAQKSLNTINGTDYLAKLVSLEKERDDARKNWKAVTGIKDLKEGYLSLAVHEILELLRQYPGLIALEDLNFGFKRGRFHVERQVYQKFEKMLIDKLNFCVFKDKAPEEAGGIRHAYQLTQPFESFQKLGKQSGFLFYIPAAYSSKIDPRTGFVNLFSSAQLQYHSVEAAREFFGRMLGIGYDEKRACYAFRFRYSDFALNKTDFMDEWCVYTAGSGRILHTRVNGRDTSAVVEITERMAALFSKYGIENAGEMRDAVLTVSKPEFYRELLWLFGGTVQLRYEDKDNDFILSPVQKDGAFFDSRSASPTEPLDGDANGAYHIALQGLRLITERVKNGKVTADEKGRQLVNWLRFAQLKPFER